MNAIKEGGDKPLEKGGEGDCSSGPVKKRGCTDILCCLVFVAHWVILLGVFAIALTRGNPARLYAHGDWKGAKCGQEENWNPWNSDKKGPSWSTKGYDKKAFLWNVNGMMGPAANGIACQAWGLGMAAIKAKVATGLELSPEAKALVASPDWESRPGASLACVPGGGALATMDELSDPSKMIDKLIGGKPSIMEQLEKYFYASCVTDCAAPTNHNIQLRDKMRPPQYLPTDQIGDPIPSTGWRVWEFRPAVDDPWWHIANDLWSIPEMRTAGFAFTGAWKFKALPQAVCADEPQYCVPFPAIEYTEIAGICMFKIPAGAAFAAAGAAAGAALDGMGSAAEVVDFGTMIGDIEVAWAGILLVAFLSLVIGFCFLIFLRFCVGYIVWGSIILVFGLLFGGGAYAYMMSTCETKTSPIAAAPATGNSTSAASSSSSGNSTRVLVEVASALTVRALSTATTTEYEDCKEKDPSMRDMYKYMAYVMWGFAGLYLLFILCMCTRIKLGIAINKVAAKFVYQTKMIIFLPVWQILFCMIWWLIWLVGAMHIVSQYSDDSAPKGPFTYDEAAGTVTVPGKCTDTWPTGSYFRDEHTAANYVAWGSAPAPVSPPSGNGTAAASTGNSTLRTLYEPNGALVLVPRRVLAATPSDGPQNTLAKHLYDSSVTCGNPAHLKHKRKCFRCSLPNYMIDPSKDPSFFYAWFSLLWNNAFIIAVGQCTIAGAVAFWYFSPLEKKGTEAVILPAFKNCFRYHLGSLAFGAFILAVVQMIKWILYYIQKQAEAQKNYVLAKIAMALQCCVRCFERFIKFLNKNAYIQIAILGKNFCRSAFNAFCLILRNAARIGVLAVIGRMVNAIGVAFITVFTAVVGYFIIDALYNDPKDPEISSPWLIVALFVIMGYICAKLFMNVFGLAVDTILQCFVADEELHRGSSGGGAQYTPEELKVFLKDKDKKKGCC